MKSQKGFTLVESIVIAVVVGVLALVAIKLYTGYVAETQQDTVNSMAQTAAASANAFFRKTGEDPDVEDLDLFLPEEDRFTVVIDADAKEIEVTDDKYGVTGTANY